MVAGEDLDERRFPAPVLADKAVDLSTPNAHADLVQRPLSTERHGHVAHDECLVHGLVSDLVFSHLYCFGLLSQTPELGVFDLVRAIALGERRRDASLGGVVRGEEAER